MAGRGTASAATGAEKERLGAGEIVARENGSRLCGSAMTGGCTVLCDEDDGDVGATSGRLSDFG